MTATRFGPDELALLEEERDFLLRSLDDLEREREEGNVTDEEYERLHDDYTARAAATIRSIRDGVDATPQAPPVSGKRRAAVTAGVLVFAALAAVLLGRTMGERLPGETITGNEQLTDDAVVEEVALSVDALADRVARSPEDVELRLAYADVLLREGQGAEALEQYDHAARLDPDNALARASGAMIVFNAGLVDEALERLVEAEAADPEFADTWFFRGIVLATGQGDRSGARAAFEQYLDLAPEGTYAGHARSALEGLESGTSKTKARDSDREDPDPGA